ncbi:hypothetical protein [Rhizobium herbae]|uniref:Uncharacterized protein n=1 Tax=Rhizobium herbae TaxID=508661 RepID=A0ABS4EK39_9HYPH|nr:hypothetical protein [Rhizobium herbae]MBP1858314.1 hypothetical protein [Rhizobium herbae]
MMNSEANTGFKKKHRAWQPADGPAKEKGRVKTRPLRPVSTTAASTSVVNRWKRIPWAQYGNGM